MVYRYFFSIILLGFTSVSNAAVECSVVNNPDGCICTEESHPSYCTVDIPEGDPWYTGLINWAKNNINYSSTSTGWDLSWKYLCNGAPCVKTYDNEGLSRNVFYVNESITYDIASTGLESVVTDALYGLNNSILTENGGWLYEVGWAYHGTYLDSSCHSKLSVFRSTFNGEGYSNWYWSEVAGCNSTGFKGYYGGPGFTQATSYSYDTPGIYWISAIPMVFHGNGAGFRNAATVKVQGGFKRIVVVDANGCIYGQCFSESEIKYGNKNLAWLVPIISLILN